MPKKLQEFIKTNTKVNVLRSLTKFFWPLRVDLGICTNKCARAEGRKVTLTLAREW